MKFLTLAKFFLRPKFYSNNLQTFSDTVLTESSLDENTHGKDPFRDKFV